MKLRKTQPNRRRSPKPRPLPKPERAVAAARPGPAPSGTHPPSPLAQAPEHATEESQRVALWAAQAGLDKKASGVEIIDVTGKVDYADYLVLMTGQSDRHVAAIAHAVDQLLSEHGHDAISVEGLPRANWVLIDFVDVVVHVFLQEVRSLYDLDGLWMDAGRVPVPDHTPRP